MDASGEETNHAAKELGEKEMENGQPEQPSTESAKEEGHAIDTSGSSSRDEPAVEKLDSKIIKAPDEKDGEEALSRLPEHERQIIKRQLDTPPVDISYFTLYKYATRFDCVVLGVSILCSIAGGAALPLGTVGICHLPVWLT
jgi:ATP-binding cassette, subfamily B (MDR/TAP), member 1